MDFIRVAYKEVQSKDTGNMYREYYPAILALESQDLVIRGGQFVAIWDADKGLYSRRLPHLPDIVDRAFAKMVGDDLRPGDIIRKVRNFDNQIFNRLMSLIRSIGDMGPDLDRKIIFANETPTKEDAATFKMEYSLEDGHTNAWNVILETLYDPDERTKIEWAIGSILTGASVSQVQKFYVFYGPPGSGKSTVMNAIEMLLAGHTAPFSAKEMGRNDSQFSLEPFKNNPLVAIDQDSDLSRIETNVNLNQIISHDKININSKGKSLYEIIPRSTLFVGSNSPVKITDKKSGLYRRLVDIQPSGRHIEENEYHNLVAQLKFELGAIAQRCINVFQEYGPTYLSSYRATDMMYRTNDIFNFVEDNRLILAQGCSLKQAHKMYTEWCEETDTKNIYKQFQFRDLLKDYFNEYHEQKMVDHVRHRSYYEGLKELEKFSWKGLTPKPTRDWLELGPMPSLLDERYAGMPAQVASASGHPIKFWDGSEKIVKGEKIIPRPDQIVSTTLADIDTSVEHFTLVPKEDIVIDIDLKDEEGVKSLEKCLEEAALWPPTYAEASRSGDGLHLHYAYSGDVSRLALSVRDGVEIKTLLGNASLRRRLSVCNSHEVSTISTGLPLKEEKVLAPETQQTEKGLRVSILKGLRKDVHPGTKSNMDFIKMVLDKAYESGIKYDVSDMWDDILQFAMGSSNQKATCIEIAMGLKLQSEEDIEAAPDTSEKPIAYFDMEVYPNLVAFGYMVDRDDAQVVKLLNPTPGEMESILENYRLLGFNNRNYDNHIIHAITMGWDNAAIYELSKAIIEGNRGRMFGAAYNLAYGDLYDIIVEKRSLKWWEIYLGLPHMEMDLPWDQPVPEDRILDVLDYLANDVKSTRAVAKHREGDFRARQILAALSGLAVCNTNRQHTEALVFRGEEPRLEYTDLSQQFPGYTFDPFKPGKEKSLYKGVYVSEGGWVDSEPGMYEVVEVLDVASMHPSSIIAMNCFGPHTKNFKQLMDLRLALKRKDFVGALEIMPEVEPFITIPHEGYDLNGAKALSDALKIVINSVYGLTAASFPNKFRDDRNKDNIVAKRGALFMVDLKEFIESLGLKVVHVKTDSVKVPDMDGAAWDRVKEFAAGYGYDLEHEDTYERFCLVNDAVYVNYSRKDQEWQATGAQFQHAMVFKTLFSKEDYSPKDYVEVKQVQKGAMYLVREETGHKQFVGRFGAFVPVIGGRLLLRIDGEKEHAVSNTKGYLWELEKDAFGADPVYDIDMSYFQRLIDEARLQIEKFGDYAEFTRP